LTLLALILYQAPELWSRASAAWADRRSMALVDESRS
jgi:hypothetical protein